MKLPIQASTTCHCVYSMEWNNGKIYNQCKQENTYTKAFIEMMTLGNFIQPTLKQLKSLVQHNKSELISFREKAGATKRLFILLSIFNGLRMDKAHGDYVLTHEKAV